MEINTLPSSLYSANQESTISQDYDTVNRILAKNNKVSEEERTDSKKLESSINKLKKSLENQDFDIRFKVHEKTGILMVQITNKKTNEVLREFPQHELLDVKARISIHIGIVLDLKA